MVTALIDGDILAYEFGGLKKRAGSDAEFCPDIQEGEPLPLEVCWGALCKRIEDICKAVNADKYKVYLSSQKIKTWRYEVATILPYKGQRASERPIHWEDLRQYMELHHPSEVCEFIEADDALSIAQYEDFFSLYGSKDNLEQLTPHLNTVICTRDKDLDMVPGLHYSWGMGNQKEKTLWLQTPVGGLRCFYKQLLTGDKTDNILGLYGVGVKSTLVSKIDKMETEKEMFEHVYQCYVDRFGSFATQFMTENGQLLWMQRSRADRWNPWVTGEVDTWREESAE